MVRRFRLGDKEEEEMEAEEEEKMRVLENSRTKSNSFCVHTVGFFSRSDVNLISDLFEVYQFDGTLKLSRFSRSQWHKIMLAMLIFLPVSLMDEFSSMLSSALRCNLIVYGSRYLQTGNYGQVILGVCKFALSFICKRDYHGIAAVLLMSK